MPLLREKQDTPYARLRCHATGSARAPLPRKITDVFKLGGQCKGSGVHLIGVGELTNVRNVEAKGAIDNSNNDRMFTRVEFERLERLTSKFTRDGFANASGDNAMCNDYCSQQRPFESLHHNGAHLWMNPPFDNIHKHIMHYKECKAKDPHGLSACIVVPVWTRATWWPMLKNMRMLK